MPSGLGKGCFKRQEQLEQGFLRESGPHPNPSGLMSADYPVNLPYVAPLYLVPLTTL